ncbi:hypothetical protein A4S06_04080 [Erysipelotrichaceae bacterium MTC7]|nr:hypothetical protein A4S06_04080 [Erysipelotrichaceae bacterium MTC7]
MKYFEGIRMQVVVLLVLESIALILLLAIGLIDAAIPLIIIFIVNAVFVAWTINSIQNARENEAVNISEILGNEAGGAFSFGKVGIITYNEQFEVLWISNFLVDRGYKNLVGKKVTTFVPAIEDLLQGGQDTVVGTKKEYTYEISRKGQEHVLFVRDISLYSDLKDRFKRESLVLGLVHMDNYQDIQAFEDETTITNVNLNLRQPIVDWANKHGICIRRLRSDRFFMVLDEEIYQQILGEKFDILNYIRNKAAEIDVNITLSMSFARGEEKLSELDGKVSDLLELAQSRGGDQVASQLNDEDIKYYGGKSEAKSTRSRVRVRVMAQAIKDVMQDSDQIFITGHKEMDFDCMGSNLALSRLAQFYKKKTYIVSQSGGIEKHTKEAMVYFGSSLENRHTFITQEEALRMRKKNDLVIVSDYHNPAQSNAQELVEKAERILVIDHHRRGPDFVKKPLIVYLESSASSTCELMTELIAYQPGKVDINDAEASIMYLGIVIDTNHFQMRTGFRTFEACAQLKKWGVDPMQVETLLKEDYTEFEEKINVLKYAKKFNDNILISCVEDSRIMTRSLMSIGADELLAIRNIEAAFVVARINENQVAVSARSKGVVNVQVIMEAMHGGGHFTAAAVQKESMTSEELYEELEAAIRNYLNQEDTSYESNLT